MDEHDDEVILKLTCFNCDNPDCDKTSKSISIEDLTGCLRWVPEDIYEQYIHYMTEVIPFWHLYNEEYINDSYIKIYNFLQKIYKDYPIEHLLNRKGKIIGG